jgi:F5/8 type C domain
VEATCRYLMATRAISTRRFSCLGHTAPRQYLVAGAGELHLEFFGGRVEPPTGLENMEDQMLRKQILITHQTMSGRGAAEKDIAAVATVLVSSEDPRHPIDYAFDGQRGPGASRWIAEQSGEQTLILAFDAPQTIRKILVEVEEPETSRTQEMAVSISQDGGQTYRELIRQEYNFSPPGTTLEHEEWSIKADAISHLQLRIKPDKGGKGGRATLTTLALE